MFILTKQFFSREVGSKAGRHTRKVGATIKKVYAYFQLHIYKHTMQPTSYRQLLSEGGFACYQYQVSMQKLIAALSLTLVCRPAFQFASLEQERTVADWGRQTVKQTDLTS